MATVRAGPNVKNLGGVVFTGALAVSCQRTATV
jgi:hypothetical protein